MSRSLTTANTLHGQARLIDFRPRIRSARPAPKDRIERAWRLGVGSWVPREETAVDRAELALLKSYPFPTVADYRVDDPGVHRLVGGARHATATHDHLAAEQVASDRPIAPGCRPFGAFKG